MPGTLASTHHDAARGLASEPAPAAALTVETGLELNDDELEDVVGGLARVYLPNVPISTARPPA